jgi:hypothetical protein
MAPARRPSRPFPRPYVPTSGAAPKEENLDG